MIEWLSQYSGYIVLLSFSAAFLGICVWAYLPRNRDDLEKHRNIPFSEVE